MNLNLEIDIILLDKEKEILKHLYEYPTIIKNAGDQFSPALVANYLYDLVKLFNSFYQNVSIFGEEDKAKRTMRLLLCQAVANNIKVTGKILGISMPNKM
jgi:arginyl-tRNA synthetase